LEVGCGVGNTVFPLLETHPSLFFYACDFAPKAIELLKVQFTIFNTLSAPNRSFPSQQNELYKLNRCIADVCDIVNEDTGAKLNIPDGSLDSVIMIFVLSAISPGHFVSVVTKLARVLLPPSSLGSFDLTILFSSSSQME